MFGLFKKKSVEEKLREEYKKLSEEAYHLSKTDRTASDAKMALADQIMDQLEAMQKSG
jgi:hypothetical protein